MRFLTAEQLGSLEFSSQPVRETILQFFTDLENNNWDWSKAWNGSTFTAIFDGLNRTYLRDKAQINKILSFKAMNEKKQKVQARASSSNGFDNSVFAKSSVAKVDDGCDGCTKDGSQLDEYKRQHQGKGIPLVGGGTTADLAKKASKAKIEAKIQAGDVFPKSQQQIQHTITNDQNNSLQNIGEGKEVILEPLKDMEGKRKFAKWLNTNAEGNQMLVRANLEMLHLTLTAKEVEGDPTDKELKNTVYDLIQEWRATNGE